MSDVVLVIEDEPGIVDFLERGLSAHGFAVRSAFDGISGTEMAISPDVDVVVLDMRLPGRSGLEVLAELRRAKPTLPVIVLTALGEIDDRVAGLDAGATDYLTKPFAVSELAARVRAQLRVASQTTTTKLRAGDIETDLLKREVRRGERQIRLSGTEFDCSCISCRTEGGHSPAARSSEPCGATTTTPGPTWWTCTSATCAASCETAILLRR